MERNGVLCVQWSGVNWRAVEWCGVVWSGVEWCGVVWSGVEWCGVVLYDALSYVVLGQFAFFNVPRNM